MGYARKYKNKKYTVDGITFDSKREANRYWELNALQKAGIIQNLELQVKFVLIPTQRAESKEVYKTGRNKGQLKAGEILERECSYIADFVYMENGKKVVEDAKGFKTEAYNIKKKLMLYVHGIRIKEV